MRRIWPNLTKEELRTIKKDLKGLEATGLATAPELIEWSKKILREALDTTAEYQKEYTPGEPKGPS
jgi:hypothetical protein